MKLREITGDLLEIYQMFADDEIDEQTFKDTLEAGLKDDLQNKADGYGTIMAEIDADILKVSAEIERLTKVKQTLKNHKEDMKDCLKFAVKTFVETTGEKNLQGTLYTFGIKKNPPALKITDEDAIPFEYMIPQPPKVDNDRLKKELKAGTKFDFCHLEQGESLTIK